MYKAIYNQVFKNGKPVAECVFPQAAARYAAAHNRGWGYQSRHYTLPNEAAALQFALSREFVPAYFKRLRLGYVQLYRRHFGVNPPSVAAAIDWLCTLWDKPIPSCDDRLAAANWFLSLV
jgi:hypothetical protein